LMQLRAQNSKQKQNHMCLKRDSVIKMRESVWNMKKFEITKWCRKANLYMKYQLLVLVKLNIMVL
jgi:hypothetical protein